MTTYTPPRMVFITPYVPVSPPKPKVCPKCGTAIPGDDLSVPEFLVGASFLLFAMVWVLVGIVSVLDGFQGYRRPKLKVFTLLFFSSFVGWFIGRVLGKTLE